MVTTHMTTTITAVFQYAYRSGTGQACCSGDNSQFKIPQGVKKSKGWTLVFHSMKKAHASSSSRGSCAINVGRSSRSNRTF